MPRARITIAHSIDEVDPARWDALVGDDDPFTEHAFLAALERSGSVGQGSGWQPAHVLLERGGTLVGAMPLYLKSHSYGEYIFDWGWANAAERAGIHYYPKLVSAVPFTPATGRRMLVADDAPETRGALAQAAREVADAARASSIHVLFCTEAESTALADEHEYLPRLTHQYHWDNTGYASFDEYLGTFRSPARKQVRRERRQASEAGLELVTRAGPELTDAEWAALERFYRTTVRQKGGMAYLTAAFFAEVRRALPHRVMATLALSGGEAVAGALFFHKGKSLYGRYWGSDHAQESLHFELCYYRPIELCIERGLLRFEAGAQGEHKVRRGLMPTPTYSAHWIRHSGLREAVAEYLPREARATRDEMAWLSAHGPFRRPSD